ncbi:excisionase family DNA-binding protein [Kutzneria sp. NPDC051319]|uniref:excisionase family DNA-binding protein n=1 Tax=Kutzneria sp. NPDC051319 TaxID=3155047 RepID=UPI00343EC233
MARKLNHRLSADATIAPERRVVRDSPRATPERYLNVEQAAERLGTTVRFVRRLIEERRIAFAKFGRHVRIAESVLAGYIESCTVAVRAEHRRGRAA